MKTRNIFDYNAMKRFKITMDALPENSTVINKPHSFYEDHKSTVAITLAVFTGLVAFIIVLSLNILKRVRAEKELRKHRDQLEVLVQERTAELTETNRALVNSEERFRCLSDAGLEGIAFTEKGIIVEVNSACCGMFGYRRPEVINKTGTDFTAPEERKTVERNMASGLEQPYVTSGLKKTALPFPSKSRDGCFPIKAAPSGLRPFGISPGRCGPRKRSIRCGTYCRSVCSAKKSGTIKATGSGSISTKIF